MAQNYFFGYSTVGRPIKKDWTYYDIELIKRDLLNYFNTRVGERVMRPDWGCKIWDYFMEPMTPAIQDLIIAEATRICQSDSRVTVVDISTASYANGLRVALTLSYAPMNVVQSFTVDFEARQADELGFD